MKSFVAFTKKEFRENFRTYKFFIMMTVFLLLGMMNPITAKITPQLIKSFIPKGIVISITEPTALDSWLQFYKNVPQMGLIVLVIIFSGIISTEFSRGTLINMLTKGLSRGVVILSKFTMASTIWTLNYIICFIVTYAYTAYFWSNDGINNLIFSAFSLWIFGILLIAIVLFGGVVFRNSFGGLLFTGGIVVILTLLNIPPSLQKYNPIILASDNMSLLASAKDTSDYKISVIVCCISIFVFIFSSIKIFNKKQL